MINCKKCVWGLLISQKKIQCPFAKCFMGDNIVAKKSQKAMGKSDVSRSDGAEVLSGAQEGNRQAV